ncbi:MAG TPA: CxxH/CxxC protein [Clostridiales bacterium]|nr:CxxH/CxxC protein [Clostridiales bacterium]
MEKEAVIYACKEHVEMAIDDFVNTAEAAPQIIKVQNERCSYCEEKAEYEIKG